MANPFDEDDGHRYRPQSSMSMKKDVLEDSMLESTRRAINMLNETEEVGVESAKELVNQGEALQRIDEKLSRMDSGLTSTHKNISKLKSPFGSFGARLFGSTKSMLSSAAKGSGNMSKSTSAETNLSKFLQNPDDHATAAAKSNGTSFHQLTGSDREKEVEQNLNDMSSCLTRLKGLATNMGDEINRQNALISNVKGKSEKVESKMTGQRDALQKLLKK